METVDALIIGGGAVGCAIADELAPASVILLEKNTTLGDEQSGRNSGVIHAGLYYKPDSLAARLCVEGNQLLYAFCSRNNIPHRRVGKIIVCQEGEESTLETLLRNSQECGASAVSIISQAEIKKREPHVVASAALLSLSTGIVQAAAYVQCLAQRAAEQGAIILTNTKAVEIEPVSDGFIVSTNSRGSCKASLLINAAGLYADAIASLVNPTNTFTIAPRRGEYYSYHPNRENIVVHGNVYPLPTPVSLGVHLTPTFDHNKILVGPYSIPFAKKDDYGGERAPPEAFIAEIKSFFPSLQVSDLSLDYCGIVARLSGSRSDFIIQQDAMYQNCIHLIGIASPGLTASLPIGQYVKQLVKGIL